MSKILVVNECAELGQTVAEILRKEGHEVIFSACAKEAVGQCQCGKIDLLLCDLYFPEERDSSSISKVCAPIGNIAQANPNLPILAITCQESAAHIGSAVKSKMVRILAKPFGREELLGIVEKALGN